MTENAFYPHLRAPRPGARRAARAADARHGGSFFLAATALAYETRAQAVAWFPPRSRRAAADRSPGAHVRASCCATSCSTPLLGGIALLAVLARGRARPQRCSSPPRRLRRGDALALRRRQRCRGGSSGTSPSSSCTSASFPCSRSSCSALAAGAVDRAGARVRRRHGRRSLRSWPSRWRRSRRSRAAAHRGAQPLLRRAARSSRALVLWIERGMPRPPRRDRGGRGGDRGARRRLFPYERFIDTSATSGHVRRCSRSWYDRDLVRAPAENIRWLVAGAARGRRARAAGLAPLPRLLGASRRCVVPALPRRDAAGRQRDAARVDRRALPGHHASPTATGSPAIVGSATPTGRRPLDGRRRPAHRLNENEFFNRDVGPIYTTERAVPGGLAADARGGRP